MNRILLAILMVLLSGCAAPPRTLPSPRMAFPEAEYLRLKTVGTSVVKGQAFLKTRAGDVKTAAGNAVFLNPVTSYSLAWYQVVIVQGLPMDPPDSRLSSYMRTQIADGSGRFIFKNVPSGEYFITTAVTWEAATGYQGALTTQGGVITKRIKVGENEELDEIVTK